MKVFFSHFWPDLRAEYSPFFLALRENFSNVELTADEKEADVVFYSIFGDSPYDIKIDKRNFLYVGESHQYIEKAFSEQFKNIIRDINLIGSNPKNDMALSNFRFTEWMWQINWFNKNELADTFSLKEIQNKLPNNLFRKNKAAFVSRYSTHEWLSSRYDFIKQLELLGLSIDKFGFDRYLAPGYRNKIKVLKKYKVQLPFENNISPGYVTEKLFHGLLAGGINIYYGDDAAKTDFNPTLFLHFKKAAELPEIFDSVLNKLHNKKYLNSIRRESIFVRQPSIDKFTEHLYKICK